MPRGDLQLARRLDVLDRDRALRGERRTSPTVRSSNGSTVSRHNTITPITRSLVFIGTPSIVRNPPSPKARAIV